MKITVSLDELREHEQKLEMRHVNRCDHTLRWILENRMQDYRTSGYKVDADEFKKEMAKWDQENPAPKLIPSV